MVTNTSEKINSHAVYRSLRKQPIFCYVTTGFSRNERRNSKLMTCYHPTLGNASDWLIGLYVGSNRLFPSGTKPQFQSEAKCETHFHKRGFALSLGLKERESFRKSKVAYWCKQNNKSARGARVFTLFTVIAWLRPDSFPGGRKHKTTVSFLFFSTRTRSSRI